MIEASGKYNGRGGLYYSEKLCFCESAGIEATREQNLVMRMYPDKKMRDLLNAENISAAFRYSEVLHQRVEEARKLYRDAAVELL